MTKLVREHGPQLPGGLAALLLHSVPGMGEQAIRRALARIAQTRIGPDEWAALPAETLRAEYRIDPASIETLTGSRDALLAAARETLRSLRLHDVSVLTIESAAYPARIERNHESPPPILYTRGRMDLLAAQNPPAPFTFFVAVSNGASPESASAAAEAASALVAAGGIPVTGHDRPAFQDLALAAARVNRPAIYVLDRGLREALGPAFDRPLFPALRIYETSFMAERDLAISPFRLHDHGLGGNNRRRDRLVFALADLIVAAEVRAGGSMLAECLDAKAAGRPVLVLPGSSEGAARLLAEGCPAVSPKECAAAFADRAAAP